MAKRIEYNGKFYRVRRGTIVEIPEEWVGKTTHKQTLRKRHKKDNSLAKKTKRR